MGPQVKAALDRINSTRSRTVEAVSALTDDDLDLVDPEGYWTIRKWLYRMLDHEAIHLGQIVRIRRSIEPTWKAAVRFREIDRLIGELHILRGRLAAELVGLPDEMLDARADELPSIREVLEHVSEGETGYVKRIAAIRDGQ